MRCSQIFTVGVHGLHVDLVLFRLVDMGLSEMFSYLHCMYLEPTCESAKVILYAPTHRQDSTSRGALAGMRNSSVGPPYEGSIRRLIAP